VGIYRDFSARFCQAVAPKFNDILTVF